MKGYIQTVLACLVIGVCFAGLLGYLNTNGIMVDEYITASFTITDLQTVVVALWIIVGQILGVRRR